MLVQASVRSRFTTKPFEFVSDNQLAALKIGNQQVINRVLEQSFGKLVFERLLPPFKISNVIWFWHDIPRTRA